MATLVHIQGLSGRGFRVKDDTGAWKTCKEGVTVQVDVDHEGTKKILAREKDNFIRVASGVATTTTLAFLNRYGVRIKNNAGTIVKAKLGSGLHTFDLTKGEVRRVLRRSKAGSWLYSINGSIAAIRGIVDEQTGFEVRAQATAVLTGTGNPLDTETVTIGSRTYTFQSVLTNVNGNVKIGATLADSLTNLANAVTLAGGVAGTDYAAATVAHADVAQAIATATTVTFVAGATQLGADGNALASTETSTVASFAGATFSGGSNAAKVYEGQTVRVAITAPRVYTQLRRHFKSWVEV